MLGASMQPRMCSIIAVLGLFAVSTLAGAAEPAATRFEKDGLKLEIAPLDADQVSAFFLARGFAAAQARRIVETACVFRSAIGNSQSAEGSPEVTVVLGDWRVVPVGGQPGPPKVREDWDTLWKELGVPEDAATAFHWSLFPTAQSFFPTDYNWGFLTFGLPPGTVFDLVVTWRRGSASQATTIEGLRCAR